MLQQGFNKAATAPTAAQIQMGVELIDEVRRQMPDFALMKSFINQGADLTAMDDSGNTVFMTTLGWGNSDLTNSMVGKITDFNHQNAGGNTALHLAVLKSPADLVQRMIDGGALVTIPNISGQTPADLAQQRGDAGVLAVFKKIADEKTRQMAEQFRQQQDAARQRRLAAQKSTVVSKPFKTLKPLRFRYG
ncbi:MAG: ankyrin repeat domain-containing protein [Micavibrio sp.]|nr:ankyrin repeat domain-containing protein [Micavibrio sp.]